MGHTEVVAVKVCVCVCVCVSVSVSVCMSVCLCVMSDTEVVAVKVPNDRLLYFIEGIFTTGFTITVVNTSSSKYWWL